jgi:hypothetical protein
MPARPAISISPDNPDRLLVVEPDGGQQLWVAGHQITIKAPTASKASKRTSVSSTRCCIRCRKPSV